MANILKGIAGAITRSIKKSIKGIAIVCAVIITVFTFFEGVGYYSSGESDGITQSYVSHNNSISPSSATSIKSSAGVEELSVANASCLAYYKLISKNKSCWQEYTDENGKTILITMDDERAVSDAFDNDEKYYIEPNLLYAMNRYLYDGNFVYPEAFLKPVAYEVDDEGKYHLVSLIDKKKINVDSEVYLSDGTDTEKTQKSVSDYGLGSVIKYKKEKKEKILKGTYTMEDYYDKATGTIKTKTLATPEEFKFVLESDEENVVDTAVTFAGVIEYAYTDDEQLTTACTEGTTSTETENVTKYKYSTVKIDTYYANGPSGIVKSFTSTEEMEKFCSTASNFSPAVDKDGNYKVTSKSYDLYKYRSSDSGIYTNFVKVDTNATKTSDEDTGYLYDYLENFETYKPIVDRSNDLFVNLSGTATVGSLSSSLLSGESSSGGTGSNDFEIFYSQEDTREIIETIWDVLVVWGYSEEQAAAILGNITKESGFQVAVEDKTAAYGICQWTDTRRTQLFNFAKKYYNSDTPDILAEAQFICMEAMDGWNQYSSNQWLINDSTKAQWETFKTSDDIEEITEAFARGWERAEDSYKMHLDQRKACANSAYKLLQGRTPELTEEEVLVPDEDGGDESGASSSKVVSGVSNMSADDKEKFNSFYHLVDDIYNGECTLEFYSNHLTSEDAELIIKTANSFINGTSLSEESLNIDGQMWSDEYLTDLVQKETEDKEKTAESDKDTDSDIFIAQEGEYIWPVSGTTITSYFGPRIAPTNGASTNHLGIDIGATYGESVRAAKDGTVTFAGYGASGGNYVMIDHGNGVTTMYLHNSVLCVTAGQKVKQGQKIAEAGSTGVSTGTHCHLSFIVNGSYENPLNYVTVPTSSN